MNPHFEAHIKEVHTWYNAGDTSLALRRLTDSAIETQDTAVFAETIGFYEWLEARKERTDAEIREKAFTLLEKIKNAGVKTTNADVAANKILTVKNVHKQYSNNGFKIKNINLNLNDRQITGLVGENGNGKTTLLRLLAAELKPDSGTIHYDFAPRADQYDLRAKLIYIEQRIPRWYGTLMDNLKFVLPYYGIKGKDNHLWAEIMIARLGLRPYRHLTWSRLSSGYRTRFELAKTLLRRPKILLLDEPLANLDIISQQTILQDLKYMASSVSAPFGMILSSQHIYEVEKVSDTIIFIKNGTPQYQENNKPTGTTEQPVQQELILEMEVDCERETLNNALAQLKLTKIHFNGGVYLLHFDNSTTLSTVLEALAVNHIEPNYLRNISQSSRRFFIS